MPTPAQRVLAALVLVAVGTALAVSLSMRDSRQTATSSSADPGREPKPGGDAAVTVAPDVFGELEDGLYPWTGFAVRSEQPQDAVVAALVATGRRWSRITDTGEDLSALSDEAFHARLEHLRREQGRQEWDIPYTPNFIFPVVKGPLGPELSADCKDGMTPAMARTLLEVLREELAAAGVTEARVLKAPPSTGSSPVLAEI